MFYMAPRERIAGFFLLPLREKVGGGAARMRGTKKHSDSVRQSTIFNTQCHPSSVTLRVPPSPARGEGK